jgi:hypothetical protein
MGRLSARVLRPRPYAAKGALQCAVVAFDIAGFGDRRRDDDVQLYVRAGLYRILEESFEDAGVPWRECHREDRGDGVLVVVPALVATESLISPLTERVRAGLRRHNKLSSEPAQIRLRMALHAGHVHFDAYGVAGQTLVHAFRLLEAPTFKTAFAATGRELGCVVSDRLYDDVIRHGPGLIDPDLYDAISVSVKETEARAWVHFPPGAVRPALNAWPHMVGPAAAGA